MYRPQHTAITGFQIADADDTISQDIRGSIIPSFATMREESHTGWEDWNITYPGDPANMMFWPLDPTGVPTRGSVVGSYSYAIPARRLPPVAVVPPPAGGPGSSPVTPGGPAGGGGGMPPPAGFPPAPPVPGKFLPLDIPGFLAYDYEALDIEEAGPDDWIILATVKHGDRRKLAFKSPNPIGFRLCADHRSDVAPDLSSIVHDGRPVKSLDEVRTAGLHTTWEVREYAVPGSQAASYQKWVGGTGGGWDGSKQTYALSWVGDLSSDSQTGFCNIVYGDQMALHSWMMGGNFKPSFKEKHWLSQTPHDGPYVCGGLGTAGYHVGTKMPFTAPLDFEEEYYKQPADSTYEYKVFLWYDKKRKHHHKLGEREGLWRWFTRVPIGETPKCSPTKDDDYKKTSSDVTKNPARSFAEDSRGIMHQKLITPGLLFSARPNLLRGKIPGTATRYI